MSMPFFSPQYTFFNPLKDLCVCFWTAEENQNRGENLMISKRLKVHIFK